MSIENSGSLLATVSQNYIKGKRTNGNIFNYTEFWLIRENIQNLPAGWTFYLDWISRRDKYFK